MREVRFTKNWFVLLIIALAITPSVSAVIVTIDQGTHIWDPKIIVNYTEEVLITDYSIRDVNALDTYDLIASPGLGPPAVYSKSHMFWSDKKPLLPSTYQLTLIAADRSGLPTHPDQVDTVEFTIEGMDITLIEPENGWSDTAPYDIVWTTEKEAVCKWQWYFTTWDVMQGTSSGSTPTTTHTAPSQNLRGDFFIMCKDGVEETPAKFFVGWDNTPPEITVQATPENVTDPRYKWTVFKVTTDENATCTLDGEYFPDEDPVIASTFKTYHEELKYFNTINDNNRHQFEFTVECENLAGLSSSTTVPVTVNFGEFSDIQVLQPDEITTLSSFDLVVQPTYAGEECRSNGELMSVHTSIPNTWKKGYAKPFLVEGENSFELNCTGAKNRTRTYVVTIDSIAPPAPTLNASPAVCFNKIRASFNVSSEPIDYYNYSVRDSTGELFKGFTPGGPRQFVELDLGSTAVTNPATWSVYATDDAGNDGSSSTQSVELRPGEDGECGLPPFIQLVQPPLGCGLSSPYPAELLSTRDANCRYSTDTGAEWEEREILSTTDNRKHTDTFSFFDADVEIMCRETNLREHFKTFYFCVDDTSPKMGVTAVPETVVSRANAIVTLTVTTDDRTYCTYGGNKFDSSDNPDSQDSYKTEHTTLLDFRSDTNDNPHDVDYEIVCRNLANLANATDFSILINFGMPFDIEMISPEPATSDTAITFSIKPNKPVTSCEFSDIGATGPYKSFGSETAGVFSEILGNLGEGTHEYWVSCLAASDQAIKKFSFIVDRSVPELTGLNGVSVACVGTDVKYTYNVSGSLGSPVVQIQLDGTAGVTFEANTSAPFIEIPTTGLTPGLYTATFTPISAAGVAGTPKVKSLSVKDILDPACTAAPDHCTNGILDAGENATDCGGTCPPCVSCVSDLQCTPKVCVGGVCVPIVVPAACGNGAVDVGESCDGTNLAGLSCTDLGFTGGTLGCKSGCLLDTSGCIGPTNGTCGDAIVNVNESCDGSQVLGLTCADFSFTGGSLKCDSNCDIDTNFCTLASKTTCLDASECPNLDDECIGGYCMPRPDGCMFNIDCDKGYECSSAGKCVPIGGVIPPIDLCTEDEDCLLDEECVSGECVPVSEKGVDWLALILIILGILVMGGAGYWLWTLNEQKKAEEATKASTQATAPQRGIPQQKPMSPEERKKLAEEQKARAEAAEKARKQREAEKENERKELFNKFGETKPAEKQDVKPQIPQGTVKSEVKKPESTPKPKSEDGYVDLAKIGKKQEPQKKPQPKPQPKSQKKQDEEDVFDELEKL